MTDYKATPEQWAQCEDWVKSSVVGASDACILELRSRVQVLEEAAQKHSVETSSNIGALFRRIESLEAAERQASKIYQISKPLKLTAEQQEQLNALLRPANSQPSPNSSQIGSSLAERVQNAIYIEYARSESVGQPEARAAIREVAAWLREQDNAAAACQRVAIALEQEAER